MLGGSSVASSRQLPHAWPSMRVQVLQPPWGSYFLHTEVYTIWRSQMTDG